MREADRDRDTIVYCLLIDCAVLLLLVDKDGDDDDDG